MTYKSTRAACARRLPAFGREAATQPTYRGLSRLWLFTGLLAAFLLLVACGEEQSGGVTDAEAGAVDSHASEEGADVGVVHLSDAAAQTVGIVVASAEAGELNVPLRLPAEIQFDPDRLARVSTPISGVVSRVMASEGDTVVRGQALAILSSRELAELKTDYIDAVSAEELAKTDAARAERLWASEAVSEAGVQTARSLSARATAARESAETKLHAIDIDHDIIDGLVDAADGTRSQYSLTTPISGQVVQRTLTLGEAVGSGEDADIALFVIADASVVWADIAVYRQDISRVSLNAPVDLVDEAGGVLAQGVVSFISPVIDETSRTVSARVIVDNQNGALRPGQFVTAIVGIVGGARVLHVPEGAVQTVEGRSAIFVPHPEGFVVRPVTLGRKAGGQVEILAGLSVGESFVTEGAFTLKAELGKSAFGDGHAH